MLNHWSKPYFNQPISQISSLTGGFQHQLDLIKLADESQWVCKQFRPQTWLGKITLSQLKLAEEFSSLVASKLNLSSPSFASSISPIIRLEKSIYGMIFSYCKGSISNAIGEEQAYLLGRKLAKLHYFSKNCANHFKKNSEAFPLISFSGEINQHNKNLKLDKLIQESNAYLHEGSEHWVLTHRDLNLTNIVWKDQKHPCIIDWESTGLMHPTVELLGLAMNCAGIPNLYFDIDLFRATIQGYKSDSSYPKLPAHLWIQSLHSWLLWYAFCVSQKESQNAIDSLAIIELIQSNRELMQTII